MNAHSQCVPDGQVLGIAVFIDADVLETFIDPQQGEIEYMPEATPDGILIMRSLQVAIKKLGATASSAYISPRTLIRTWVLQRLEAEQMNGNPAVGVGLAGTSPNADTQPNHEGVIADDTGI